MAASTRSTYPRRSRQSFTIVLSEYRRAPKQLSDLIVLDPHKTLPGNLQAIGVLHANASDCGTQLHRPIPSIFSEPTDSFAVNTRRYKQQVKITMHSVYPDDHTANRLAVLHDPVCLTAVDGLIDCFAGYDLSVFFKVIIP